MAIGNQIFLFNIWRRLAQRDWFIHMGEPLSSHILVTRRHAALMGWAAWDQFLNKLFSSLFLTLA